MLTNLKGLFTPQAIAETFKTLPVIKTTIIDKAFPTSQNHPYPSVGIGELKKVTGTIPFVRRSGNPIKLDNDSLSANIIAPIPLMPSVEITAAELNDLKLIIGNAAARDVWQRQKLDDLRRVVRATTEAIASVVLTTGKYNWAVNLGSGKHEKFEIDFGELPEVAGSSITASSKLSDVYDLLSAMSEKIEDNGYGGEIEFMAGKKMFGLLINVAQSWSAAAKSPISITLEQNCINIGGYRVYRMAERYKEPIGQSAAPKVGDNDLVAYSTEAGARVIYAAIDSITANNQAVPFNVYVKEIDDRAYELIAQSKPVPVRPSRSTCIYHNI